MRDRSYFFSTDLRGRDEITLKFVRSVQRENNMAKLTIHLKGVAICYYTVPLFKVLFPFNPDHLIKFLFNPVPGQPTEIGLGKASRTVTITTSKVDPLFTPPVFSDFIDITAPGDSHDEIEKLPNWDDHGVLLTVNDGEFVQSKLSDCRFGLRLKGGSDTKDAVRIRYEGSFEINDPRISIAIYPPLAGFPDPIMFEGRTEEVTFDNTCPKCPTDDDSFDFDMIYKVIKDTTTTRQFAMKRYFWDKPFFLAKLLEVFVWGLGAKKKLFGIEPKTNPSRFAVGLPCNINVATKPEKLP